MFYKIIRGLAVVLWQLYFNIKCVGEENIPESGGYILAANHQTMNDPVFAAEKVKRQMYFMAKAELFENGFLRWFFNKLGAFPIQRGKGDSGAIQWAAKLIEEGKILAMFPEGTRSKDGKTLRPKSGVAVIAHQTKASVLPCGIKLVGGKAHFRSKVIVSYGKLITYEELGFHEGSTHEIKEASIKIMNSINQLLEEQP